MTPLFPERQDQKGLRIRPTWVVKPSLGLLRHVSSECRIFLVGHQLECPASHCSCHPLPIKPEIGWWLVWCHLWGLGMLGDAHSPMRSQPCVHVSLKMMCCQLVQNNADSCNVWHRQHPKTGSTKGCLCRWFVQWVPGVVFSIQVISWQSHSWCLLPISCIVTSSWDRHSANSCTNSFCV